MSSRPPRLVRKLWRSFQALIQAIGTSFIRTFFLPIKQKAGFVLPTATLVLLVVTLLVGTLIIRTGQEAEEAIREQAQQEIFNAATPAVDRAKAKLEFLFRDDPRFPVGIPSERFLNSMMLNDGEEVVAQNEDPYMICEEDDCSGDNDETRLDIDGDGEVDNAWAYTTDNGERIAYSISLLTENNNEDFRDSALEDKADNLVVRSGPLNVGSSTEAQSCADLSRLSIDNDWFTVTGSTVRKNFQIDAVAINDSETNPAVSTIEVQQDRQLDFGNKWGAWFRYDLEFTPGPEFNWNGALHTEGSLIVNNNGGNNTTRFRLVSAPASCFYTKEASDITMAQNSDDDGNITYQGQVMRADTDADQFEDANSADVLVDLFPGANEAPSEDTNTLELELPDTSDSVQADGRPSLYYLDPVLLVSEDISQARNPDDPTNESIRDEAWETENPLHGEGEGRIDNQDARQPYVDDTYRADDRWGPKPTYTGEFSLADPGINNGALIDDEPRLTYNPPANDAANAGLDGYWERRANAEGLRIIVGERLELGNEAGWEGSDDPLYKQDTEYDDLENVESAEYDNLVAVQSGVVYHWDDEDHDPANPEPLTCLALTAHQNDESTQFQRIEIDGDEFLETNFFEERGTNGWEFPFYDNFATDINDNGSDLRIALTNLAHFAGDPDGAFPPVQEDGGDTIHPFPELAMWGNFSNLRRAIDRLDDGEDYDDLSLADKTTLQTATCTLGMLAYNIDYKEQEFAQRVSDDGESLQSEGVQISQLVDGTCSGGNPEIIDPNLYSTGEGGGGGPCSNALFDGSDWTDDDDIDNSDEGDPDNYVPGCTDDDPSEFTPGCDEPDVYRQFTRDELLTHAGLSEAEIEDLTEEVEAIIQGSQIERDRQHGFAQGGPPTVPDTISGANFPYNPETGLAGPQQVADQDNVYIRTGCDPDIFGEVTASGSGGGSNDRAQVGLSLAFCRDLLEPAYPSLYYLFPFDSHDHDGGGSQPIGERYIDSPYIVDVNDDYDYQALSDLSNIELSPIPEFAQLQLPTEIGGDTNPITLIDVDGSEADVSVAFLDKLFYNFRENMTVRVLDLDLDLLRNSTVSGGDTWLPTGVDNSSIVYAFREDAVREDGIARPRNRDWDDCNEEELITAINLTDNGSVGNVLTGTRRNNSDDCRMFFTEDDGPQDPPLNDATGVSVKPVDSYPDPDRRPYGFRLRNGADISRDTDDEPDPTGLSFITDQAVYIQGNFNQHEESEFNDEGSAFYERSNLNEDFATPSGESWRTGEIIADSITLLSADFDDENDTENPAPSGDIEVNSILISGLEPSLSEKYNGGIHNFPRFLEDWGGTVTISGSFIQLNFSNYSTGSFSQQNLDSENPEDLEVANAGDNLSYYSPPTRNWGYDVGLQYNPPGPVAERFVSPSDARTETYRELAVDDPYIQNLLNAMNSEE